jgi:hypothetical protein
MRSGLIMLVTVAGLALLSSPAMAQSTGTLDLSEGSVAVGIGFSWGHGTLTYQGKQYRVKVEGLSVGELGLDRATASGKVSNLKKLADFNGNYTGGGAGATVGGGASASILKNQNGVVLELKSTTQGASLKLAASGLNLTIEQ